MSSPPAPDAPRLLLVTADLFLGSRLKGLAEQAGYRVVTAPNLSPAADLSADRVLLDLAAPGVDPATAVERVGSDAAERIAAYAPHVRVDLLRAARAAGLTAVFTRGQLETELPRWLA